MLKPKRYADDGNAKKYAEHQMGQTYPDTAYQYPEDIHEHAQAASAIGPAADLPAKREQRQ